MHIQKDIPFLTSWVEPFLFLSQAVFLRKQWRDSDSLRSLHALHQSKTLRCHLRFWGVVD